MYQVAAKLRETVNFAHSASEEVAKKIGQKLGSVVLGTFVKADQ